MSITSIFYSTWHRFKQNWPSQCPLCRLPALGGLLCKACRHDCLLSRQVGQFCRTCAIKISSQDDLCAECQINPPPFRLAVAAVDYDFPIPLLMHQYKKLCHIHLSAVCADLIWHALQEQFPNWPTTLQAWVAVPSSASTLKRRGFNPALEIARKLSAYNDLPCFLTALKVNERVEPAVQKKASRDRRWQQAFNRYEGNKPMNGQWVGLVDDVMTTGSTLSACAQVLLDQGAAGVVAVVLARTPRTLAQF